MIEVVYLSGPLQGFHHANQLVCMRGSNSASLMQDVSQLSIRYLPNMQLQEARAESPAHCFPAGISPSRVLGGKEHEVGMRLDHLMQLWDKKLLVVIQKPAESEIDIKD